MQELEIKLLEIDVGKTRQILLELGAVKTFDTGILADFFINERKEKIRLRRTDVGNFMTFKRRLQDAGIMHNEEHEVIFDDYDAMVQILLAIGFARYGQSRKHRESYTLGKIIFDIDTHEGIPTYVEVESTSREQVRRGVELLGYTMEQGATLSERELKALYGMDAGKEAGGL
jgi:adenylate cyclase class 2